MRPKTRKLEKSRQIARPVLARNHVLTIGTFEADRLAQRRATVGGNRRRVNPEPSLRNKWDEVAGDPFDRRGAGTEVGHVSVLARGP